MHEAHTKQIIARIVFIPVRLIFAYIQYFFLTGMVFFSLAVIFFLIILIHPNTSFDFLRYLGFIHPKLAQTTVHLDLRDIMQIFSVLSLYVMVLVGGLTLLLKHAFDIHLKMTVKRKLLLYVVFITCANVIALLLVREKNADSDLYPVFIFYYTLNIVSACGYFFLSGVTKKLSTKIDQRKVPQMREKPIQKKANRT